MVHLLSRGACRPRHALAAAAAALLAACGGGGGDSPAPAFDAANYVAVAEPVTETVQASVGVGTLLNEALVQGPPAEGPTALHQRPALEQPTVLRPVSEPCADAGSLDGNVDDADANGQLSAGDSASLSSNGCVVRGVPIGGGLTLRVNGYAYTPTPYAESADVAVGFVGLSAAGNTLNGGATLNGSVNDAQGELTLRFTDTALATPNHSALLNYSVRFVGSRALGVGTESFDGALRLDGRDYTLAQIVPFTLDSEGLSPGGTLELREAQGARLRIVAGTTNFIYQYFAPGNAGEVPDSMTVGPDIPG